LNGRIGTNWSGRTAFRDGNNALRRISLKVFT